MCMCDLAKYSYVDAVMRSNIIFMLLRIWAKIFDAAPAPPNFIETLFNGIKVNILFCSDSV
jgi:hypothetical protein